MALVHLDSFYVSRASNLKVQQPIAIYLKIVHLGNKPVVPLLVRRRRKVMTNAVVQTSITVATVYSPCLLWASVKTAEKDVLLFTL